MVGIKNMENTSSSLDAKKKKKSAKDIPNQSQYFNFDLYLPKANDLFWFSKQKIQEK